MEITGYKYNTEEEAIQARKQCANYHGLPKDPTYVTKYYVDYEIADLDTPQFLYIRFYEGTQPVLGEPITFNVTS
jgi:hypothetical protein